MSLQMRQPRRQLDCNLMRHSKPETPRYPAARLPTHRKEHFGRRRWVDHLRSGVQDQPDKMGPSAVGCLPAFPASSRLPDWMPPAHATPHPMAAKTDAWGGTQRLADGRKRQWGSGTQWTLVPTPPPAPFCLLPSGFGLWLQISSCAPVILPLCPLSGEVMRHRESLKHRTEEQNSVSHMPLLPGRRRDCGSGWDVDERRTGEKNMRVHTNMCTPTSRAARLTTAKKQRQPKHPATGKM
ncbi:uncharacterized protein LOC103789720 isoform X2 [Callithrix jacchus]